ncbi:hypothetical protein CAC42_6687 [Sphaceloma murrayae]|uniref:Uncharacterized protein n=1 Tax=Sphaceloma murrayae TaxID=2082308 RepID=A0A2K1QG63_9PEZI|nr:hypothetical protein CAC42_6687 [Sphaceloma murrayae]
MTTFEIGDAEFGALKDKVILVTGCATGIGYATAKRAHANGAKLILADWNEKDTLKLVEELGSKDVVFRKTDVSNFDDVLEVFQLGQVTFGKIDAVISNAGAAQLSKGLFEDEYDESGKLKAPSLRSIEVNLHAHLYMVKCAAHYFKKSPNEKHQIIMTGSAASIIDTPPQYLYCAAKAGVLGLMRSLRTQLIKDGTSVNMVAPWMTVSQMLPQWIVDMWGDLPANTPDGVGRALLLPIVKPDVNGCTFWVAGNNIVELEEKLHETQPLWMGAELSKAVDAGQLKMIPYM